MGDSNIYSIIDKYVNYTKGAYPKMLDKYLKMYGKSAFLLLLNQDNGKDSDDYIVAFGKAAMSYDFNDPRFYHYPVKVLIDYNDWAKVTTGVDMTVMLYLPPDSRYTHAGYTPTVQMGDILTFIVGKAQYFYRVDQIPETYMEVLFRCSLKMASKKDIDTKAKVGRVITQPIQMPKEDTWQSDRIDKMETIVNPMDDNFGIENGKGTEDIYVPTEGDVPTDIDVAKPKKVTRTKVDEYGNIVEEG